MPEIQSFVTETFTFLSIGILVIGLRTFSRLKMFRVHRLWADDYLMLLVIVPYTVESVLAYQVATKYHGLANSGMTDEARATLSPDDVEYMLRVGGSKTQIAGWCMYTTVLWTIKASLCTFYLRLTFGLNTLRNAIYVGFGLILATYICLIAIFLGTCHPFHRMWQIYPDPGNVCQPGISRIYILSTVTLNIITDLYILLITIMMLRGTNIPIIKKIGVFVLFSGGLFVMAAGLLRCFIILKDPLNGPSQAALWAMRETFAAVVTSNLPIIWGWARQKLKPYLGSLLSSVDSNTKVHGTLVIADQAGKDSIVSSKCQHGNAYSQTNGRLKHETDVENMDGFSSDSISPSSNPDWLQIRPARLSTTKTFYAEVLEGVEVAVGPSTLSTPLEPIPPAKMKSSLV
ncbi:hypothetical protein JX265_002722 [Neoarthrinium moseri]|uniref:Rhodopsin domain-containing protein n=1 Tax=Neoarthrinium moseri TaxID=1658444 RepID=A0A9P9WUZ2_9PEZI|nr:hypothetical protein JX265_002722 [Neoarthrinium moseri]